jgi:RimJ/RimL family protein N-acetyltransferase
LITLEPMSSELFASYIKEAVSHFSREYVIAGICNEKEAVAICRATYEKSLPLGIATPDNHLFAINRPEGPVTIGMAWLAIWKHSGKHSAFICDVFIRPEWRNKGYGTQTMQLLEKKSRELKNVSEIGLHVLWQNEVAQSVYKKLGFKPTGINMIKHLDVENI